MRTTYPEAEFDLTDVTAQEDSILESGTAAGFADLTLLKNESSMRQYGTMELNQFLLDGSMEVFPDEHPSDVAFWSAAISDKDGNFKKLPGLQVAFTKPHSSVGLNLYFSGDVPSQVKVEWYGLEGEKLAEEVFSPDGNIFLCGKEVVEYGKLVFSFYGTMKPFHYVKMDYIEYGFKWNLGRDSIKTASIYEEIDPISATLSINTANVQFIDERDNFNLSRQEGLWRFLQKEQGIRLVEYVDSRAVECGTFYLDSWSVQKNLVSFSFIDLIGIIDKTSFYNGAVYENEEAGVIIDSIMSSCGVTDYTISADVYSIKLNGWLGIQSHRAALQQVVFACGAVADCSRSSGIRIYRPDKYVSHTIGRDKRFMGTKITLDEYISDVSVDYTQYVPESSEVQVYKGIMSPGVNRIDFSQPYLAGSLSVNKGTLVEGSVNYAVVSVEEETECIITGRKYTAVKNSCSAGIRVMASGKIRKMKQYSGCTVMDAVLAKEAAERILEYYQMQQLVKMRYINCGEGVGDWCNITMPNAKYAITGITGQSIDLTGGFISTAKCRGYYKRLTDYYITGEIYAGESTGIL